MRSGGVFEGAAIFFDGSDEDVFRGVFHINKLEHLDLVALLFEPFAAEGVGNEGTEFFPDNAPFEKCFEFWRNFASGSVLFAAVLQLSIYLMLAAGYA